MRRIVLFLVSAVALVAQTQSYPPVSGGLTVNGSVGTITLSTAGVPVVTPTGAVGITSYSYAIVAKQADGSHTAVTANGSTTTGNATLNSTHYNALSWAASLNASAYDVYRTVGGATQGKVATVTSTSYNDQGAIGDATTAPTFNNSGSISGNNASIGGKLTVAQATPATSSDTCSTGQIVADTDYVYACTATNTWKRSALTTW